MRVSPLVLAVPSKGRLKEQVERWLSECGCGLTIASSGRGCSPLCTIGIGPIPWIAWLRWVALLTYKAVHDDKDGCDAQRHT